MRSYIKRYQLMHPKVYYLGNRSGRLARSGDFRVRNWAEMVVGQEADYAVFLADGTKNMEPRPSMVTAIDNKSRDMETTMLQNLKESINDK